MSETLSTYNYKVVRQFAVMTVVWGIVGMLVGVIIAAQLVWPELNFGPWLSYGRLRPLHTNAVIFAFGGSALIGTSYYVVYNHDVSTTTTHAATVVDSISADLTTGAQTDMTLAPQPTQAQTEVDQLTNAKLHWHFRLNPEMRDFLQP